MKAKMIVLGLIASSVIGCAQDRHYYNDNGNYNSGSYEQESANTQFVSVVESRPIYDSAVERTPYEYCKNVRVPVRRNSGFDAENGLGTLIGGVAGGILGHQIGGGSGKTVATIGGAILGSAVGNNLSRRHDDRVHYEQRRECETRYREVNRRVLTGYNNIGYYKGQRIVKFSPNRLRTIPVQVTISY